MKITIESEFFEKKSGARYLVEFERISGMVQKLVAVENGI